MMRHLRIGVFSTDRQDPKPSKESTRMTTFRLALRNMVWAKVFLSGCLLFAGWSSVACADSFTVANLVTNDQSANPAQITDPVIPGKPSGLVNAWGISYGATSPFWVSANGSGVSNLYSVNPANDMTSKVPLTVVIPGDGSVTGQVFNTANGAGAFNKDLFLFVSEDGTISGWRGALGTKAEVLQTGSPDNVYKGTALATIGVNTYLYAANFHSGAIDVLKGTPGAPNLTGNFTDPNLPAGYAPFNIELIGGKLYITYALTQPGSNDEQHGPGLGFVSVFDTQGNFLNRVVSPGGSLDAPWGMAIAPSSFRSFAGDLLVGSFGDGRISAFNLSNNNHFDGRLLGIDGKPLVIDGLWGLIPGNGGAGGSKNEIYFSAGPQDESNGVFGSLVAVPEPSSVVLGLLAIGMVAAGSRWQVRRKVELSA
jgi:uncharacterized protein (TIGR03118 family)